MALSPTLRKRAAARAVLALPIAALLFLAPTPGAVAASAESSGSAGSSTGSLADGGLEQANDPGWMGRVPDATNLTALSIPGTHDTMAVDATIVSETQDSGLPVQLRAGVRALDIRTRHFRDAFSIHHGPEYLNANFTDVVRDTTGFLREHPTESVLMRIQSEHTEAENTRSFEATLDWYIRDNPDTKELLREHLWIPPAGYDGRIPTLGETRGRIVILQNFAAVGTFGPRWGGTRMDIQDSYKLAGLADVPLKWDKAHAHFERSNQGSPDTLYVNHLSATGADPAAIAQGVLPVTVAKGAPGVTGMNQRALDYLRTAAVERTGTVMADFPTAELVAEIVAHNFR